MKRVYDDYLRDLLEANGYALGGVALIFAVGLGIAWKALAGQNLS